MNALVYLAIFAFCSVKVCEGSLSKLINESSPLIVGGANALRGKYPWQALLYYNNRFRCGGSLINDKFILTAAHCVQDDIAQRWGRFKIAVGKFKLKRRDTTEQNRLIKTVTVHPDYIPREDQHDVAVLELEMPIVLSSTVQPVILATAKFDLMATKWMACYATGFGLVSHDQERLASALQELKTSFISKMQCKTMAQKLFNARASITKPTTCTQDTDAGVCNGDSGGPVGCFNQNGTYVQIGLLSWGSQYCPEGFNVFMRVSQYRRWIKSIAGKIMYMDPDLQFS